MLGDNPGCAVRVRLHPVQIMALGMAIQKVVTAHKLRPPIDAVEPELLAASKACDVAVVGGGARCTIKSAYMLAKLNETGQGKAG